MRRFQKIGNMGIDLDKAKETWEKAFKKKMTKAEETMFKWGYTYAINDYMNYLKGRDIRIKNQKEVN